MYFRSLNLNYDHNGLGKYHNFNRFPHVYISSNIIFYAVFLLKTYTRENISYKK